MFNVHAINSQISIIKNLILIRIRKLFFILTLPILSMLYGCEQPMVQGTMDEAYQYANASEYKKALAIYRYHAVNKNSAKAKANIGVFYLQGYGVNEDSRKAYDMILEAANMEFAPAYKILGDMNSNGVYEKDSSGNDIIWVNCHRAIVTCEHLVTASIWWNTKAIAAGDKGGILNILNELYSGASVAEIYAWVKLAENHDLEVSFYKDRLTRFKDEMSDDEQRKASLWAEKLISLYGVNSTAYLKI